MYELNQYSKDSYSNTIKRENGARSLIEFPQISSTKKLYNKWNALSFIEQGKH